jgi:hypothetical protein
MGWISGLWTQGFEWKWCLEEPILNLRMFLSAKGLLGRVTKLRRSSGRIKPQPVWYLTRPSDLEKVQEGYPGSLSEFGRSGVH